MTCPFKRLLSYIKLIVVIAIHEIWKRTESQHKQNHKKTIMKFIGWDTFSISYVLSQLDLKIFHRALNGSMLTGINIIQELLIAQQQEDELSCFHPIEVWKAIDLFIRIKEKEEAARESTSTTQFCLESSTEKGWLHFKCLPLAMDELKYQVEMATPLWYDGSV